MNKTAKGGAVAVAIVAAFAMGKADKPKDVKPAPVAPIVAEAPAFPAAGEVTYRLVEITNDKKDWVITGTVTQAGKTAIYTVSVPKNSVGKYHSKKGEFEGTVTIDSVE